MLDLDPGRKAVAPRDAATVMVVRPAALGVEVFCVKRHARSGFLGGAVVFPGGKLDESDTDHLFDELTTGLGQRARAFSDDPGRALSFAVAALRELLEEAAILPVKGQRLDAGRAQALRNELAELAKSGDEARAFAELLRKHSLIADTAGLHALWRWVTPTAEARRYDTRFYVLVLPEGQLGAHDQHETTESFWATPESVLERWERGEIFMAPPTTRSLEIFAAAQTVEDVMRIAGRQSLEPVLPHFALEGDRAVLALPGDPLYPETHPAPSDPGAPTRFVLTGGRFVGERV